jgi:nucleotide-binding universal stress UspA family protein
MLPIHTILHPTDFSEQSGHALRFAAALARDYGARLVVLHAAEIPPVGYAEGVIIPNTEEPIRAARQQFERLEVPQLGVPVERRFEVGGPTETILQTAADVHADLIVMGTHGRTGIARFLMGSVAEQVVRRAPCPVLTMTAPYAEAAEPVAALAAAVC